MSRVSKYSTLFLRNLWAVFTAFMLIGLLSILFSAYLLVKNSAEESTNYLLQDLSHRIEVTYNLLEAFSELPQLKDISLPIQKRAWILKPYADAFHFWMIGVVDPDGTISSTLRNKVGKVERDYIPRIMFTGKREISDPFPAGATGEMVYTQFMPIKRDGKVVSICFVSTPLTHLDKLLTTSKLVGNGYALLLDSTGAIMAHPEKEKLLTPIEILTASETFLYGSSREQFHADLKAGRSGEFLSLFNNSFYFTIFSRLADTDWMLIHRILIVSAVRNTLFGLAIQCALYLLLFLVLYRYTNLFITHRVKPVDDMLRQVANLTPNLGGDGFQGDVSTFLNLSRKGLSDALTGLPTRTLFRQAAEDALRRMPDQLFVLFFIDMDNLKSINDHLGHKYGDEALKRFASTLNAFTERHAGLCCRYGGDEFVLMLPVSAPDEAEGLARELLAIQQGSVSDDVQTFSYNASIGMSFYPLEEGNLEEALQTADMALYSAKQKGKGRYSFYRPLQAQDSSDGD